MDHYFFSRCIFIVSVLRHILSRFLKNNLIPGSSTVTPPIGNLDRALLSVSRPRLAKREQTESFVVGLSTLGQPEEIRPVAARVSWSYQLLKTCLPFSIMMQDLNLNDVNVHIDNDVLKRNI